MCDIYQNNDVSEEFQFFFGHCFECFLLHSCVYECTFFYIRKDKNEISKEVINLCSLLAKIEGLVCLLIIWMMNLLRRSLVCME